MNRFTFNPLNCHGNYDGSESAVEALARRGFRQNDGRDANSRNSTGTVVSDPVDRIQRRLDALQARGYISQKEHSKYATTLRSVRIEHHDGTVVDRASGRARGQRSADSQQRSLQFNPVLQEMEYELNLVEERAHSTKQRRSTQYQHQPHLQHRPAQRPPNNSPTNFNCLSSAGAMMRDRSKGLGRFAPRTSPNSSGPDASSSKDGSKADTNESGRRGKDGTRDRGNVAVVSGSGNVSQHSYPSAQTVTSNTSTNGEQAVRRGNANVTPVQRSSTGTVYQRRPVLPASHSNVSSTATEKTSGRGKQPKARPIDPSNPPSICQPAQLESLLTDAELSEIFVETCFFARTGFIQPPCCMQCAYSNSKDGTAAPPSSAAGCARWVVWRKNASILLSPDSLDSNVLVLQCHVAYKLLKGESVAGHAWDSKSRKVFALTEEERRLQLESNNNRLAAM